MSDMYENAINSIKMGIEDFQSNDDRRPVSALRNFYAGVLLLGKQCLLNAAPDAEPMSLLASKFHPVLNEDGDLEHAAKGSQTIDLGELKARFKTFGLKWPEGDIDNLQKLRNAFEHYHSPAPKEAIRQAIAESFPLVQGFFQILKLDPSDELHEAWGTMLAEEAFFSKQKAKCDASFEKLSWSSLLERTDMVDCSACGSSLVTQTDEMNSDPTSIDGKCLACGEQFSAEETVQIIVQGEYGIDAYISAKDGGEYAILDCPECAESTYVFSGDVNLCFWCEESITGECARCFTDLTVHNQSVNNPNLCDYCDYASAKVMAE